LTGPLTPPVLLSIAGSDSGAGAGIQADLKTFAALGCYGTSVVTAVTAQNTVRVNAVHRLPIGVVTAQLDAVLADFSIAMVKVGMLGDAAQVIAQRAAAGVLPAMVLDPVLSASSGDPLGSVGAVRRLLPYAKVVTPNRAEAAALLGRPVVTADDALAAARELAERGPDAVVVTGGDSADGPVDNLWITGVGGAQIPGQRVDTRNSHGTGCSFASALAARLALGDDITAATAAAKEYVARALVGAREWQLGAGHGPLDHLGWSGN